MLEPGVFITQETKYYDVSGSTENELVAQTTSLGPDGFMARTDPFYIWNCTFRAQDGSCRIDQVRVDTLITFTYPRWSDPKGDLKLAEWWERSLASVEEHERGHEGTARQASQEIYDALNQLPPDPSCDELKQTVNARAQTVIEKAKKIDQEFDRVADHGRLQTVKNP